MSSIGTGYDLSVTTFSPDGRVFQIEYAAKAVDNSGTVVGIKCKDGIVMGVEKLIASKMMLPGSNRRIHSVHRHTGMAVAGLAADGRQIVARGKSEATNYDNKFRATICTPVCPNVDCDCHEYSFEIIWYHRNACFACSSNAGYLNFQVIQVLRMLPLCSHVAVPMANPSLSKSLLNVLLATCTYVPSIGGFVGKGKCSHVHFLRCRPFGCGVILGGYDRDGPQLYMIEPSGISYRYFGAAIGKGKQAAKTEIEKLKLSEMTCREGVLEVAKIIYKVHDEAKDKAFELELSWVCDESNRLHQKVPVELLEEAKSAARTALEEMDAD
ncbi:unnamed protein product [Linum tenue]|uniref:Proteasome alpha-type subunits domain-containing protein n=1 Tax=Linum tenue TaxID=586396 RepID=A0AAV0IJI9_9ROSI|nr:unnamed protein product [Linum tenue]